MECEVIVDNISREEWERYAGNFADYSIYQTWPYQHTRAETDNQQISTALVKDENGKVVTICQVRIKRIKLLGLRIGYVQWGPLFRAMDGTLKCFIPALKALCKAYIGNKVNVLRVVPAICDDETGRKFAEMLISSGFQPVSRLTPYRTLMLRVDDSEEGIRKRLRKSFRRDLKKAEKTGIEIRESCDETFCEILKELYLTSLRRKGFSGPVVEEFIRPQGLLSPAEKMNIIVAYRDDEPVSALLASHLGDTALVLLAASNEKGLACGASYLIWYRGAVSAFNTGMRWYDLGGIDPENNASVFRFKSRMGGQEVCHIGCFDACYSMSKKLIWQIIERAYKAIKK